MPDDCVTSVSKGLQRPQQLLYAAVFQVGTFIGLHQTPDHSQCLGIKKPRRERRGFSHLEVGALGFGLVVFLILLVGVIVARNQVLGPVHQVAGHFRGFSEGFRMGHGVHGVGGRVLHFVEGFVA